MIRLQRIIKNTVISIIGQVVSLMSTILLSFAYGHYLGPAAFGELYFATIFVSLIGIPVLAGYNNQIVRDVAQKPDDAARFISNVLLTRLGLWFIIYGALLLISWILEYSLEVRLLIAICGIDLLCNVIVTTMMSMHYAFERTLFPVVGNTLEKGLTSILGIILLRAGAGVQVMAIVLVIGSLINAIWQAIWYFRLIRMSFVIDLKLILEILRTNIPFLISGVLLIGYTNIDTFLLSQMTNNTAVGLYGAVTRVTDAIGSLPGIVMMVIMYPVFSKLATTSDDGLKLALEKSMNFMLFCSMPIATLLIVAAPNIIVFLYGSGFRLAVPALQASAPFMLFLFINYVFVTIVLSKKLDKIVLINGLSALIFNIVLNLIMIPLFQYTGSAIASSLTELLLCCIAVFAIPLHLLPFASLRVAFKALIASLLMAIVILPLHNLYIFVILPVALVVYLGVSLILGTIPREDYQAVLNAIRKKKAQQSQNVDDPSEDLIPIFDLPTMLIPVYHRSSLLDIELALTGKLPVLRLPLAPQRTGLVTNSLGKADSPSYTLPVSLGPAYFADDPDRLTDIATMTTALLAAFHLQSMQGETKNDKSVAVTTPTNVMSVSKARADNLEVKEHSANTGGWNR